MNSVEDEMAKIAGKGFGGTAVSLAFWVVGSLEQVREWLQIVALVLSIGVAIWTIISLRNAARKSLAEADRAKADIALLNMESAAVMLDLCEACRDNKVPVQCPLAPERRPADCPRKDV